METIKVSHQMMYYGVGDVTDQSCKTDLVLPTPTQLAVTDFVILTLGRTRGWEGVDATPPPLPTHQVFPSFFL